MNVRNTQNFPLREPHELRFMRRALADVIRRAGYRVADLVCIWHPPTNKYCISLVIDWAAGMFQVIESYLPGQFSRDNFDKVWWNLDRAKRAAGIKNWIEQQLAADRQHIVTVQENERELQDMKNYIRKRLPHNVPSSIVNAL